MLLLEIWLGWGCQNWEGVSQPPSPKSLHSLTFVLCSLKYNLYVKSRDFLRIFSTIREQIFSNQRLFGCPFPSQTTRLHQLKLMEVKMSLLETLKFVAAPKRTNDPVVVRRNKLIIQLQQQRALAEDANFIAVTPRWRKDEDGSKRLVERQKRVKRWWRMDAVGSVLLTVRYGSRLIEFERGKTAIVVGDKGNLIPTIDAVIGAVSGGELDTQLDVVQRQAKKTKQRLI